MKKSLLFAVLAFLVLVLIGCSSAKPTEAPPPTNTPPKPTEPPPTDIPTPTEEPTPTVEPTPAGPMELSSTSFENEGVIPIHYGIPPFNVPYLDGRYICEGSEEGKDNFSPAAAWTNIPPKTESLVLVLTDHLHYALDFLPEDAVSTHWLVFNIPPETEGFAEAKSGELELPEGAIEGSNDYPDERGQNYGGPCPPMGKEHLYVFTLYALDTTLDADSDIWLDRLQEAMEGHILAEAEWRGYYTNQ